VVETAGRAFSAAGRALNLADLPERRLDLLIVGGGITGAGIALEAVRRGYDVGLVDAQDFAAGTSSRSSKLIHGGLRYLGQGEVGLVHEALHERGRLREMFPDLVRPLPFLMPIPRHLLQAGTLAAGFWIYDALSLGSGFPRHRRVSVAEARHLAPALQRSDIRGAWKYWDAQTDDARLTVEVIRQAAAGGALVANYTAVRHAERRDGWWNVDLEDVHGGGTLQVKCRYLVNASGVWAEQVGDLSGHAAAHVRPSKGVHVSIAATSLPIKCALAFPVGDGRILFAIPWHGYVIVGTTDGDYDGDIGSPGCSEDEVEELVRGVNRFFHLDLGADAVLSQWAGVRPLVSSGKAGESTKDLSRRPFINLADNGLLTVTGGKLTTFWRMALDALALLPGASGIPATVAPATSPPSGAVAAGQPLPGAAGYTTDDVARAVDHEMALNLDDALSRRLRLGFLDTAATWEAAPAAAAVMGERLGWSAPGEQLARLTGHLERDFGYHQDGLAKAAASLDLLRLAARAGAQEEGQPDDQEDHVGGGLEQGGGVGIADQPVQDVARGAVLGHQVAGVPDLDSRPGDPRRDPQVLEVLDGVGEEPGGDHHQGGAHPREEPAQVDLDPQFVDRDADRQGHTEPADRAHQELPGRALQGDGDGEDRGLDSFAAHRRGGDQRQRHPRAADHRAIDP
jgi:glycerol-3-phosphate dehydrogenase